MVKAFYKILFPMILATLFVSCDGLWGNSGGEPTDSKPLMKGETASRTLLVYVMAENSISGYLQTDFNEIKTAAYGLPDDARLFVYFDNSDTTRLPSLYRFYPYKNELIEDVIYTFEDDVCSSDTAVLGAVLDMIFSDYPTKSFDLVLGSHADGWVRHHAKLASNRTVGIDNGNNTYSDKTVKTIEIEELATLLERLPVKVDRLMFDACLMQGVEVAYALRNAANWIIASPAEIPANGAPYDSMIPEFFDSSSGVEDIMYVYKKAYDNDRCAALLSAIRTSHMQEFANSTRKYVKKYFSVDANNVYSDSVAYRPRETPAYYDFNSVMQSFLDEAEYKEWKEALDKVMPYEIMVSNSRKVWSQKAYCWVVVRDDFGGVSAYLPKDKYNNYLFNDDFKKTEWYKAAGWNETGW